MSAAGGREHAWVANALLWLVTAGAAVGAILGVSVFLLVGVTVLALAAGDLAGFLQLIRAGGGRRDPALLRRHLVFLLPALGLGLLAAAAGAAVTLPLPFAVMMGLVIADLACIGVAARSLFGRGPHPAGERR